MEAFVKEGSIVRKIWSSSDTILFIFGGAAAEFALNKAVDWLYFTGKLPADPLGRLFSTVTYARAIVFANWDDAYKAIDKVTGIHAGVEKARGKAIPDWAYRDVLFMLIYYSIAAFEVLERDLTKSEKEEVFQVFNEVGRRMNLTGLPQHYEEWMVMRQQHLQENLYKSKFTIDLFQQYKKHLGILRYWLLWEAQKKVVPGKVAQLLNMNRTSFVSLLLPVYKIIKRGKMDWIFKTLIFPPKFKKAIYDLDIAPAYKLIT